MDDENHNRWRMLDRATTIMALTHAIQNRVVQAMTRGNMSAEGAAVVASLSEDIASYAKKMSEVSESD